MSEERKQNELKSVILIDVDSTREQQINFSKPDSEKEPETREDAYLMVMTDIRCVTYGLATLINLAAENQFADKENLLEQCIQALRLSLADEPTEPTDEATESPESEDNTNQ